MSKFLWYRENEEIQNKSELLKMELIFFTVLVGATLALLMYIRFVFSNSKEQQISAESQESAAAAQEKEEQKWLLTSLKAHSKRILDMDFSPNGKYIATTGEDQSVIVWSVKEFAQKEHKNYRCNVAYDHSIFIKWSPDSKAFILQKSVQNCIEVYKMNKKAEGGFEFAPALTFPSKHTTDIIGLDIASNGRFIATCSDKTDLILWNLRGEILARLDTYHNLTYCVKVSPCGRSGDFEKITSAFELPGHRSGVYSFCFTPDSSRMATVSKCVCIAQDKTIRFYSAFTGELEGEITDVHTQPITRVLFDAAGKYVLTTGDKHVRVFHNVPGHRTSIQALKETLKRNMSNASAKTRIEQQITDAENTLNNILN
ncbi:transducin beta-like protein 2 [Eurytemora carolleeae]|uniref:transducin beta-like protein 2 n=1 Tax=Eurytemora carolleeae TaxID=1294199 RepID=UPI000C76BEF7|nr:transducin beta-like protein 2 [Eurytemora carolleeae]|eukprot:XP_023345836.1 transducin beta-like protein 2 [Eurytemora affinis]